MNKLEAVISKLEGFSEKKFEEDVLSIVSDHKAQAMDLNTGQLFAGRDAKGISLGGYRSPSYTEFKRSLNPAGVVDLKLTGDFYLGWYTKYDKFPVMFDSTDSKTESLKEKYGEEIFGLDQNSLEEFRQEIKPEIQEIIPAILKL